MTVLDINPSIAGIAGDMLSSSLLGLVDNPDEIIRHVVDQITPISKDFDAEIKEKSDHGIFGNSLNLRSNEVKLSAKQLEKQLGRLLKSLNIVDNYGKVAERTLEILFEAEKYVHKSEDIHLHELGTIDTLFDIITPCLILQQLNITKVNISPVNTGFGTVKTAHGVLAVPAPATQYILEQGKLPTRATIDGEATTPTGAALLVAISDLFHPAKNVIWETSSYGFGTKKLDDRPNAVVTRIGTETMESKEISVMETNLDDISGEFLGHAVERLLDLGALDVSYYPIFMKKNRPGYTLRVLARLTDTDRIGEEIMRLTGTLGIRVFQINRHLGNRTSEIRKIYVNKWNEEVQIRVKIGKRMKFEFDDLIELANKHDMTPLEIQEILLHAMEEEK